MGTLEVTKCKVRIATPFRLRSAVEFLDYMGMNLLCERGHLYRFAAHRIGAQPHRTGLTVSSGAEALVARS
jgi:hypothetical protein